MVDLENYLNQPHREKTQKPAQASPISACAQSLVGLTQPRQGTQSWKTRNPNAKRNTKRIPDPHQVRCFLFVKSQKQQTSVDVTEAVRKLQCLGLDRLCDRSMIRVSNQRRLLDQKQDRRIVRKTIRAGKRALHPLAGGRMSVYTAVFSRCQRILQCVHLPVLWDQDVHQNQTPKKAVDGGFRSI